MCSTVINVCSTVINVCSTVINGCTQYRDIQGALTGFHSFVADLTEKNVTYTVNSNALRGLR